MDLNTEFRKDKINLYVKDRISEPDARRQMKTAKVIIDRLKKQPGLILADEVGMGKTFVALAVAASVHLFDKEKRPIVVMVPSSLKEKWPRDFELFRERCLSDDIKDQFNFGKAEKAEGFLKFLDDPEERRKAIVFLTHGAMSRGLTDGWIKLALIQRALHHRWNTGKLKKALFKCMGQLLNMQWLERRHKDIWETLLKNKPDMWLKILHKFSIDPEHDFNPETDDDPVPEAIIHILDNIHTDEIYKKLDSIPLYQSKHYQHRVKDAKDVLNAELKKIWKECLRDLQVKLPLLILDEAHHLKNSQTRLASLFRSKESKNDADHVNNFLAGVFERMLFLTATPFQLGHEELCNVLERFAGISWDEGTAPGGGITKFEKELKNLKKRLDQAQLQAVCLDNAWNKLNNKDLFIKDVLFDDIENWWKELQKNPGLGSERVRNVILRFSQTKQATKEVEKSLKKWVIRHNKAKYFNKDGIDIKRRIRLTGHKIVGDNETLVKDTSERGITIKDDALLPFLISARLTALTPESRPVFAEGLASSYEAFVYTRKLRQIKSKQNCTDFDDDHNPCEENYPEVDWYLDKIEEILHLKEKGNTVYHPKISATVKKTIDLWMKGEKVLVFCHYIATGKALRKYISSGIRRVIVKGGAEKLKCKAKLVMDQLDSLGDRFFKEESRLRKTIDEEVELLLKDFQNLILHKHNIIDIVRRYLRTPSFLVRFFPLGSKNIDEKTILRALNAKDGSGISLKEMVTQFLDFLSNKCEKCERCSYISALKGIQPGSIRVKDSLASFSKEEFDDQEKELILPNVRLVNGATKQETRQKLMLTFNTPFYPDILIASSVMAEGVDLHLNCRHIIHHDLCWNPSTLEQRTGRIDRIGAKVEKCGQPINIYLPFISETQDEKMFRVVMDRERWFKVVMGEDYNVDVRTTEKLAERLPLPLSVAEELAFKLEV